MSTQVSLKASYLRPLLAIAAKGSVDELDKRRAVAVNEAFNSIENQREVGSNWEHFKSLFGYTMRVEQRVSHEKIQEWFAKKTKLSIGWAFFDYQYPKMHHEIVNLNVALQVEGDPEILIDADVLARVLEWNSMI